MKSGFVSLIGRPNAGKSTLINRLVKTKIAITSDKAQTTRNVIQGVYNDENTQIVFVDTPGIHKPSSKLGHILNKGAYYSINDVDVICFLVDTKTKLGKGDKYIIQKFNHDLPVILVLNKIDGLSKDEIFLKINEYKDLYDFSEIVPISALKDKNIDELLKVLEKYLPDNNKYFEDDYITNKSVRFMISELVREKILKLTMQEVPHSVTCYVEKMSKKEINAVIVVDKKSLKKIIIGKNGQMIRKIGMLAREDIEKFLNRNIYLNLYVKVVKNWKDKESYLKELEFTDFTE